MRYVQTVISSGVCDTIMIMRIDAPGGIPGI